MTVGSVPNSVQLVRCLEAELKTISPANGYVTNVRTVKMPDYSPTDEDWDLAMAEPTPALLLWLDTETDSGNGNTANDRPLLGVYILGMVRQDKGLQTALQGLATDVRRVMRFNLNRDHPTSGLANTWGVMTREGAYAFNYDYKKSNLGTIGMFESTWQLEYKFPRATG